jgi:hypothetical protein
MVDRLDPAKILAIVARLPWRPAATRPTIGRCISDRQARRHRALARRQKMYGNALIIRRGRGRPDLYLYPATAGVTGSCHRRRSAGSSTAIASKRLSGYGVPARSLGRGGAVAERHDHAAHIPRSRKLAPRSRGRAHRQPVDLPAGHPGPARLCKRLHRGQGGAHGPRCTPSQPPIARPYRRAGLILTLHLVST